MAKIKSKRKTKNKRNIFADIFTGILITVLIAGLILTSMQWQSWFGQSEEPAPVVPQSIEFILANKNDVSTLTQNEDGTLALPTIIDDTFIGFYTSDGTQIDSTTVFNSNDDVVIVATYGEAVVTSNIALVIDGNMYDTITTTNSELTFANLPVPETVYSAGEKDMYYTYEFENQRFVWEDVNGTAVDAQNPLALNGNTVLFGTFTWDNAPTINVTETYVNSAGEIITEFRRSAYPINDIDYYVNTGQAFAWATDNNFTVIGFYWDINHTSQISGTDLQQIVTTDTTYYVLMEEAEAHTVSFSYYDVSGDQSNAILYSQYTTSTPILELDEEIQTNMRAMQDDLQVEILGIYDIYGNPFDWGQELNSDVEIVFETKEAFIVQITADSPTYISLGTVSNYETIEFDVYNSENYMDSGTLCIYLDPTMSDYFAIVITNETLTGVNVSYSLDTMFYDVAGDQALVFVGNGLYGASGTTYVTVV